MDFKVIYDSTELGFNINFPDTKITKKLTEKLLFMTIEEAKEEILYNNLLSRIVNYTKPYILKFDGIEIIDEDIVLFIKVKDKNGINFPKLIPYKRAWFLVGTPTDRNIEGQVEMCEDMEEYSSAYKKLFDDEYSFSYLCTLDENLEIIDWNSFYDYHENNEEILKNSKKLILKKYNNFIKKIGKNLYMYIF